MIGLALSGGGSRAIAFHLGCLRALNDLRILEKVGVLSTISGGSVIGAYYAYTPQKHFDVFESEICMILREGFDRRILRELLKPKNLIRCLFASMIAQVNDAAKALAKKPPAFQRYPSRTDMFINVLKRDVFPGLDMKSPRRNDMEVVIGTCELRTGTAFRFGNRLSGSWRHGEMVMGEQDVSFAVAASAAYPILLPALDRKWLFRKKNQEVEYRVLLTDGGIYDNLGLQVLEPGRDADVSLHTFPCEHLIVCNAGRGQESGEALPMGFLTRVSRAFEVIHRRVQDSAMKRLHGMKSARLIKAFAMPYLGQQDDKLPWKPGNLILREEVISYPTNFAPMSDEWIERLSRRGEQLTRALVSYYLPDVL